MGVDHTEDDDADEVSLETVIQDGVGGWEPQDADDGRVAWRLDRPYIEGGTVVVAAQEMADGMAGSWCWYVGNIDDLCRSVQNTDMSERAAHDAAAAFVREHADGSVPPESYRPNESHQPADAATVGGGD